MATDNQVRQVELEKKVATQISDLTAHLLTQRTEICNQVQATASETRTVMDQRFEQLFNMLQRNQNNTTHPGYYTGESASAETPTNPLGAANPTKDVNFSGSRGMREPLAAST
jgi:hypothetical protein